MTAPTTEQPPNQWDVLVDFVKTMVTLATGLLALTVTFADKMTMGPGSSVERWPLIASWSLLLAATLFGVLAAALVTNYLRHGTRASGAIFLANGSFFLLLLAGGAFLVLGIRRLENSNAISASEAVSKAIQFMP